MDYYYIHCMHMYRGFKKEQTNVIIWCMSFHFPYSFVAQMYSVNFQTWSAVIVFLSSLSQGWHDDADRKMSLTSLGQDQAKFGSKTALNRRVMATPAQITCKGQCPIQFFFFFIRQCDTQV